MTKKRQERDRKQDPYKRKCEPQRKGVGMEHKNSRAHPETEFPNVPSPLIFFIIFSNHYFLGSRLKNEQKSISFF